MGRWSTTNVDSSKVAARTVVNKRAAALAVGAADSFLFFATPKWSWATKRIHWLFFFPDFSRRSPKKEPRTSSVVSYRLFQTRPDQEKVKRRPAPLTRCFGTVRVLFVRGPPHHALGGAEAKIPELRGRNGRRFSDDSLLSCLFLSSAEVEPMEDHRVKRAANGGDLFTPCTSALLLATMMDIDVSIFEASSREKKRQEKVGKRAADSR